MYINLLFTASHASGHMLNCVSLSSVTQLNDNKVDSNLQRAPSPVGACTPGSAGSAVIGVGGRCGLGFGLFGGINMNLQKNTCRSTVARLGLSIHCQSRITPKAALDTEALCLHRVQTKTGGSRKWCQRWQRCCGTSQPGKQYGRRARVFST